MEDVTSLSRPVRMTWPHIPVERPYLEYCNSGECPEQCRQFYQILLNDLFNKNSLWKSLSVVNIWRSFHYSVA